MTKKDIHECFLEKITAELAVIAGAAKKEMDTATNAEHKAKSTYDTFRQEAAHLAQGQARRAAALSDALERLQVLPLKELDETTPVQLSALVALEGADGSKRSLFFASDAGGESITVDGEEITIVTSQSPIGRAALGKFVGDTFNIKLGDETHTLTITSVE